MTAKLDRKKIIDALDATGSVMGAFRKLSGYCSLGTVQRVATSQGKGKYDSRKKGDSEEEGLEWDGKKDEASLVIRSRTIRTLDDALEVAKVDLDVWEVERYVINKWDMAAKLRRGHDKIATTELWQVKVWLKRKIKTPQEDAIELLVQNAKRLVSIPKPIKYKSGKKLLEISLFDMHFGKLAWEQETGSNYDLKIACSLYSDAISRLLEVGGKTDIDEILLPIGQDFFHINNSLSITPKGGNLLDTDGRLAKVFQTGYEAVIRGIEKCLQVAPVRVIWVPGNHDPETSLYLVHVLHAWFRERKNVSIDIQPTTRKYIRWGVNLLGFTHGDEEAYRDLPTIMATENAMDWAQTHFREWHLGHWHKAKQISYLSTDSYGGVVIRVLPSLTGTDAWHFKKGFVKSRRAAEAYLWDHDTGYIGHFAANLPTDISE